jgi:aminomethyltransferase
MSEATDPLNRTALHDRHLAAGAEMHVEDGWEMPRSYGDADEEHGRVRSRAGVFDVSHIGRLRVRGEGALEMLEHLCTADVARQEDDTAIYTLLCNEGGGIIDHALVVRLEGYWMLTCSPHRRAAVLGHLQAHAGGFGAAVDDQTLKTSMLSVVGPEAPAILDAVLPEKPSALPRGAAKVGSLLIARYLAMRSGATRLWSLEVMLPNTLAGRAWDFITARAGANVIAPAGLAVRDRLRTEAHLPRWGREIDETTSPVAAGLLHAVDLDKDFLGAPAVREAAGRA